MRPGLGQVKERAAVRSIPEASAPPTGIPTAKEIPYDYVATFKLEGRRGNRVQDVINISIEGAFVASAIGYSFIPARLVDFPRPTKEDSEPILEAVSDFFKKRADERVTAQNSLPEAMARASIFELLGLLQLFFDPRALLRCLLLRLCGIEFKYSVIDSATGRELQSQPIHNIAGLGESAGRRPFRPLAKPMIFVPRSTIRIEVEEISDGWPFTGGQLYFVLHGYKILGYGATVP